MNIRQKKFAAFAAVVSLVATLGMPVPVLAQTAVTSADIQRLQDEVYQAGTDVSRLRTTDALAARSLQMLLAYLVVVSAGTLLAAVAIGTPQAHAAALYYLLHSTWVVGGLFLLADLIARQRGDKGGALVQGPALEHPGLLGGLFFLGAIAVAGLPPLSGFLGKLLLLQALPSPALWGVLLLGGDGADVLDGQGGDDILVGGNGSDTLRGDTGHDNLSGGPGDDICEGGPGNDNLFGGTGNDTVSQGGGEGTVDGGPGTDTCSVPNTACEP